jgi:hypothetical protein
MIPACERLYDMVAHQQLTHPDDPDLNRHVHAAVARVGRRGWRLEKPDRSTNIDAAVALAIAVDAHAHQARTRRAARMALTRRCLHCGALTRESYCRRCVWRGRRNIRSGWDWSSIKAAVRSRDRACVRCGSTVRVQVHHRIPVADGGSNTLDNLELLCGDCHLSTR